MNEPRVASDGSRVARTQNSYAGDAGWKSRLFSADGDFGPPTPAATTVLA